MRKICLWVLILCLSFSNSTYAAVEKFPTGLSIEYPDLWSREMSQNAVILKSPDDKITIIGLEFSAEDTKAALAKHGKIVSLYVDDIAIEKAPVGVDINKRPGLITSGKGTIDGRKVKWMSSIVLYNEKALLTVGYAEINVYLHLRLFIKHILTSVKIRKQKRTLVLNS